MMTIDEMEMHNHMALENDRLRNLLYQLGEVNNQNIIHTNADRIRNMNNIELAKYLSELDGGGIVRFKKFKEWLDSEVES